MAVQVPALLPLLVGGATRRGWRFGQPFVVRYCRVGVLNDIGDLLDPAVVVLLIGERPGLATAESLSAYLAYRPRPGHTDAQRNLISNIHARGVLAADAARRILPLAEQMRQTQQASGVAVKEEHQGAPTEFKDRRRCPNHDSFSLLVLLAEVRVVATEQIGSYRECAGCKRRMRVPRKHDGNSRVRSIADWIIELLLYGLGCGLLAFCLGLVIMAKAPFSCAGRGHFRPGRPYRDRCVGRRSLRRKGCSTGSRSGFAITNAEHGSLAEAGFRP